MARILLLTQPECVNRLAPPLLDARAAVDIAITREDLERAVVTLDDTTRLIAFGAGVIVPASMLSRFAGPSYNFHSGPPEYPGLFPSVHALNDRKPDFGVTLHEMRADVDSGPIVAVDRFPIPKNCDRLTLDTLTFEAMVAMFTRLATTLTQTSVPFPQTQMTWSGQVKTKKDFDDLCILPATATAKDFNHRLRAIGEGPHHALTITRFGRRFQLVSEARGPIVRGGQVVSVK